jgi:hypothetical protein
MAPVTTISLPEYNVEQEPDWLPIGRKLDTIIESQFAGRRIAVRGIGMVDHPELSREELVAIIQRLGTDRYDPDREAVHGDFGSGVPIDLHAGPYLVSERVRSLRTKDQPRVAQPDYTAMGSLVRIFYGGAIADRGYPVRLDILMVYDLDQLQPAGIQWTAGEARPGPPPPPEESCDFTFKHPDRKPEALLGIIQLLREQAGAAVDLDETARAQLNLIRELTAVLTEAGIAHWLFGGWGVDFNVGEVTRPHEDIDLILWKKDAAAFRQSLTRHGYTDYPDEEPDEWHLKLQKEGQLLEATFVELREDGRIYFQEWPWADDAFTDLRGRIDEVVCPVERPETLLAAKEGYARTLEDEPAEREKHLGDAARLRRLLSL